MSTECSRETSLRLTISQAVFFLQFCALPSFDILTRRTKDTDVYSIHHHPIWFFRSIEYTMWRFYEGKKWQDWQAVDSVQILTWKSSIKGQKNVVKMILFHNLFFSIWQNYRSQFLSYAIFHYHNRPNGLCIKKFDLDAVCSKAKHCRNVFGHVLRPNFVISTQLVLNVGPWPFL